MYCPSLVCWQQIPCAQHGNSKAKPRPLANPAIEALLKRQVQGRADILAACKARRPRFPGPSILEADSFEPSSSSGTGVYLRTTMGEDLNAYEDGVEVVRAKALEIAKLLRTAKRTLVFTGAGISTSANLPDYRSKNGLWRINERGDRAEPTHFTSLDVAQPTLAHQALVRLHKLGLIHGIVTTNIDGLHRLANAQQGVSDLEVVELHGNAFEEKCTACHRTFYRDFSVVRSLDALEQAEPRACEECAGALRDTVVRFGETLPEEARAFKLAASADLALVLGTSMRVSPACNMPRTVFTQNGGKMVLVNRQNTAFEDEMWLHCYASLDLLFELVLAALESPTTQ